VVYVGSGHTVYALDASTGHELWSQHAGRVVGMSPAVAGGVVYIGSDKRDLYALRAINGRRLWSYTTGNGGVPFDPTVAGGAVYVGSGNSVYAFDLAANHKALP
jgi:outer membrane protein assembly factor BamB